MSAVSAVWPLVRDTYREWTEDEAPRLAAALAYYTAFSIGPLLVIVIAMAGALFGAEAIRGHVETQSVGLLGKDGAQMLQDVIAHASEERSGIVATVTSIVALLLGATGVFGELQSMMNTIWDVDRGVTTGGIWATIRTRLLSFGMVLGIAFLLLVSLVISAVIAAASGWSHRLLPGLDAAWKVIDAAVSLGVTTALFAMLFKFLPDTPVGWRDVVFGALLTAILFTLGKTAIGFYLGRSGVASVYGAAGSLAVMLVWVYYSAQIIFFGAELTQVYAKRHGTRAQRSAAGAPSPTTAESDARVS